MESLRRFRRLGLLAGLALLVFGFGAQAAVSIQEVVSPGGVKAWLVENHGLPIIALDVGFHGGSRLDPEAKAGLANMLSGLLDEGAGDLDSQAFQRLLVEKSIRLGFNAGRDGFYGSLRTLTKNRDEAFRLLGLALTKPRFDPEPVTRIRAQVLSILAQQKEDPDSVASKAWYAAAFPAFYPYAHPVDGYVESVKAIERADLAQYVQDFLTRDRMRIAVVGDIDAQTLGILLDQTFGGLPQSGPTPDFDLPDAKLPFGTRVIEADIPQTVAIFGGVGLLRKDPDFIPAYVMNYILGGGGFSARLMEEVRVKRGLAYHVSTQLVPYDFVGLMTGYVGTENSKAAESLKLIRAEFRRMREEGPTEQELADAKTYLTGAYPLRFDSNDDIADELLGIQIEELGIDYVNKRNDLINAVSLEDIRRVARRILHPEKLLVVAVGQPAGLGEPDRHAEEPAAAAAPPKQGPPSDAQTMPAEAPKAEAAKPSRPGAEPNEPVPGAADSTTATSPKQALPTTAPKGGATKPDQPAAEQVEGGHPADAMPAGRAESDGQSGVK